MLDALGQRWAHDLGADDYDLPGYFDKRDGGRRWRYYRNRAISHNVPLLGGVDGGELDQRIDGTATVERFASRTGQARCVLDLTAAYGAPVERLRRGVALVDSRTAVLIQDEGRLTSPRPLTFGITTRALVELDGDRAATLRLADRAVRVDVLEPATARLTVAPCTTGAGERSNRALRRLMVRVPAGDRKARVAVLLAATADADRAPAPRRHLRPLEEW